ncbi:hypothetical protein AD05_4957 [Escherichia coli 5-366-08_S4_C2]|nr:hypothetical protein ECEPECC34262_3351 [Escherichia coli EPEC C342-62]EMV37667.1 hypothetical protein ECBCE019MS13_3661 [Escherichia coli BCE019_MS-13]ENA29303.1 hypothetical protein ECBCE007MS11_3455 [Escherichia coli BCE007_MS-11]ENB23605.1 hypothetical protein ECBCE030MS09_4859 [Escherichia coli BCE030_MS-09]KEL22136.1 hypothetical protein AD05_4957 [Escherichia coli 5-366-08_S4_C2]KEL47671.1 hypothetical protein AB22_4365 [Escherichia coli 6-175-07_S1_C1]
MPMPFLCRRTYKLAQIQWINFLIYFLGEPCHRIYCFM